MKDKKNKLSDRVRSGSEAAPWVVDEIEKLENQISELKKQLELYEYLMMYSNKI